MVDPNPRAQSHLPLESRTLLQSLLPLDKALIFLLLLLVVQLAAFAIIRTSIASNARASVQEQLQFGERVFARLIEQNASKLAQGARILASDYGFREAIGSDDRETIESALSNHSARIGATLSMFYGTDGAVKASTANTVSAQEDRKSVV